QRPRRDARGGYGSGKDGAALWVLWGPLVSLVSASCSWLLAEGHLAAERCLIIAEASQVQTHIFAAVRSRGAATPHIAMLDSTTGRLLQCCNSKAWDDRGVSPGWALSRS